MREVYKNEEGEYGTIPDGDKPTLDEIIEFEIKQRSVAERRKTIKTV
jgi:hypothetical protein